MITILKPGLLSTIQDLGRYGFQKYGVITSGAMDQLALRIANLLVGNSENQAVMEITLIGPTVQFEKDSLIAICGGNFSPNINGESIHLYRPVFVTKGSQLTFGKCQNGCRAYLAIAGGLDVPLVMGSKSTYLRANIGGFLGRKLKKGDKLSLLEPNPTAEKLIKKISKKTLTKQFFELNWFPGLRFYSKYASPIRVMTGREFHLFSKESQKQFFLQTFTVTGNSDRMGYRLEGSPLTLEKRHEIISEAVSFGTIQVPADGMPIVLMADRQTTGGYPKIAQIATVDLPAVAQAKPGDPLSFQKISHEEAQHLYLKKEQEFNQLRKAIELKFSRDV
jgi:antagonist of KipI